MYCLKVDCTQTYRQTDGQRDKNNQLHGWRLIIV